MTSRTFVVEIGSNDGSLLCNFASLRCRHLGIEPSRAAASIAEMKGIRVHNAFFNMETAELIEKSYGSAHLIIAANVIAHIPTIHDTARAIRHLLHRDGIFTFEAIYLGDVVHNNAFDQLYSEHVFTFSVRAVANLFRINGLDLIDIAHQDTHGGSMRYTLVHAGTRVPSGSVSGALRYEEELGLADPITYIAFAERSKAIRCSLRDLILDLRSEGHRVVGYGANAKSATVLNWSGLGEREIEFVADNTPEKLGKIIPGTTIPIRSAEYFREQEIMYSILFAWNHRLEIDNTENGYRKRGGKWIVYVPSTAIV